MRETINKVIILSALVFLLGFKGVGQCDSVFLDPDLTICSGESAVLDAGEGYLSYLWNTGSTDQTITVTDPGDYWCTVKTVDSNNLVINGSFSAGYLGFQSDYTLNTVSLYDEGTYAVTSNPNSVHPGFQPCVDHTSGGGNMMVVNGAPIPDQVVWMETIPISPGAEYHYSGWFTSVHFSNPAILDLAINGVSIEQIGLSGVTCMWENFFEVWESGLADVAVLTIVNQNTILAGNDFAIDDISMYEVCTVTDSIHVTFAPDPIVNLGGDTVLCQGESLVLNPGPFFSEYLWQDSTQTTTFEVTGPGLYWVMVTNGQGCTAGDSIQVDFATSPEIALGNDTLVCEGENLLLSPGNGFSSYLWQDSTSASSFLVNESGTFWVTVTNEFGCSASDTIVVEVIAQPTVDLGADTWFCTGESYLLEAGTGYTGYIWQDGSTGATYTVTQTGWYWVTVSNACSEDTDSVHVVFYPLPEVDLGQDTTICSGATMLLDPGGNYASYLWQDGTSFPFYTVTSAGVYSVEVSSLQGCTNSDEVYVDVSTPQVDLGGDAYLCEGDILVLDAGDGFSTYLWQDGSNGSSYEVTESGTYNVTVTDGYNCQASDSAMVDLVAEPWVDLGGDRSICTGTSIVLQAPAGPYYSYYWNGVPGEGQYEVTDGGYYSLAVVSPCDSLSDAIYVTEVDIPEVDLGDDQLLFPGESVELDAGAGYESYQWQNGYQGQILAVDETTQSDPGHAYWVEVMLGGCKSTDTVLLEYFSVWVPSVITPNGDGKNDLFQPDPERWGAITTHRMTVFNRWGEQVWESEDFPSGWDGKQNGRPVADGTYFWVLEVYYGPQSVRQVIKGNLSVIGSKY